MLTAMRSFAKTKLALVVFGILIVALGVGIGVSDPFSGVTGGGFIRVGERSVSERDVNRLVDQKIQELSQESGEYLTVQEAAERGITQNAILELRQRAAILAYADKQGVRASSSAVTDILKDAPRFKDSLGQFDMGAVAALAQEQGFNSVQELETDYRDQLTLDYIIRSALNGVSTPTVLVQPFVSFFGERRTFSLARLTPATVSPPPPPTEEELVAFYEERQSMFAVPELRRFSVLSYSVDDFLDKVDLGEDLVKSEYDRRIKEFSTPESREFTEVTSTDRNAIQAIVDSVKTGQTLEEATNGTANVSLETRSAMPSDVADEDYRDLVFAVPVDEIVGPMQRNGEWAALIVRASTPGVATAFEDVADQIRTEMAQSDAERRYRDTYELFYDLLSGGSPLEQIATEIGAPVIDLAPVDARGITLNSGRSPLLAKYPDAMRTMFTLSPGDTSEIIEGDNERVLLRLEEIVPARTMPMEEVREDLGEIYKMVRTQEASRAAADGMAEAIKNGASFSEAAASAKMAAVRTPELTRSSQQSMDPAVLNAAFALENGATAVVADSRGEPWVVKVESIAPATLEAQALLAPQAQQEVSQSIEQDLQRIFLREVEGSVKITTNEGAIQRYLDRFKRTDQ